MVGEDVVAVLGGAKLGADDLAARVDHRLDQLVVVLGPGRDEPVGLHLPVPARDDHRLGGRRDVEVRARREARDVAVLPELAGRGALAGVAGAHGERDGAVGRQRGPALHPALLGDAVGDGDQHAVLADRGLHEAADDLLAVHTLLEGQVLDARAAPMLAGDDEGAERGVVGAPRLQELLDPTGRVGALGPDAAVGLDRRVGQHGIGVLRGGGERHQRGGAGQEGEAKRHGVSLTRGNRTVPRRYAAIEVERALSSLRCEVR